MCRRALQRRGGGPFLPLWGSFLHALAEAATGFPAGRLRASLHPTAEAAAAQAAEPPREPFAKAPETASRRTATRALGKALLGLVGCSGSSFDPGRLGPDPPRLRRDLRAAVLARLRRRAGVSKEFCDIAYGMARCLARLGALHDRLVWDREGAIAPRGRPTESFLAFCGRLALGWIILDAGDCQAKGALERSHRFLHDNFEAGRRFANQLDFQHQLDGWCERINARVHRNHARGRLGAAGRGAQADATAAQGLAGHRPALRHACRAPALPGFRPQRLLARPAPCRPPRRGARLRPS
jgi:hypothetical protein